MKVILLKDVPGTGKAGAIVEVKEGHARNYLLPRGLAKPASGGAVRELENRHQAALRRAERERAETVQQVHRLEGVIIELRGRAGEGGKLFGSVTSQQIADALAKRGFSVTRKQIELEDPIRVEGFYKVPVRVAPRTVVQIDVNVVGVR
jgi:large subunit ribosomal protein L9